MIVAAVNELGGLMTLGLFGWSFGTVLGFYVVYKLSFLVYEEVTSPLRDIPGPPSKSLIFGNFKEIWKSENSIVQERWIETYGSTLKYKGILGRSRLFTVDLKAVNHVLVNSNDYQKPEFAKYTLRRLLGEGVLIVEGDVHKKQRKVLNPAFGPPQIRELTEIFVEKSIQLRDIWAKKIAEDGNEDTGRIDALSWLSRTTLDVIGLAGFNYKFDALTVEPEKNELNKAFTVLFKADSKMDIIPILQGFFPPLRFLPHGRDAEEKTATTTMRRIGTQLLDASKAAISKDGEKSASSTRDILSVLVRANTRPDLPENQRMSDEDVLAQIPTFLVAGHETTSVATTWALFALTQNKSVQTKLREELSALSTDHPTMDELNALSYLDSVVKETLRLYAPVPFTIRTAMKDDFIPLSKPFLDLKGVVRHGIEIRKGQTLTIPIVPINRAKSLWGEDAADFRPERWQNIPEAVSGVPGIWGNMLTFLGGPRACIGYRFSLVEMKALLFTLIRAFEFDLAVPASDISKKASIVQRPILLSDPETSNQLPLLVKLVSRD